MTPTLAGGSGRRIASRGRTSTRQCNHVDGQDEAGAIEGDGGTLLPNSSRVETTRTVPSFGEESNRRTGPVPTVMPPRPGLIRRGKRER